MTDQPLTWPEAHGRMQAGGARFPGAQPLAPRHPADLTRVIESIPADD